MKKVLLAGGLLLLPDPDDGPGQAEAGSFPGGTNPDGSLRPTAPVTRLFTQDAYTEYALLEPGSEAFRIRFLPEETRAGATEIVNATRGGSEGSGIEVYDPRTGEPLKFTYEQTPNDPDEPRDSRAAADAGARRRHRPRADLQDLQGSAHLHDERQGHRVGPQPQRLPARRAAAERLRLHLVERRRADDDDGGRPAEAGVRESERPEQSGDDSRAADDGGVHAAARFDDMFFDDIKTLYDLDAPETGRIAVEQTYSDYRKGDRARLDSLAYLPLQDLKVIDLDTAKPLTPVKEGDGTFVKLDVPIVERQAERAPQDHRHAQGRPATRVVNGELVFERTLQGPAQHGAAAEGLGRLRRVAVGDDRHRAHERTRVRRVDQSERRKQLQSDDSREKGELTWRC